MERVLAPWGFDERDEAVYRAVLRRPGVTVDALAEELRLPRDEVLTCARKLVRGRLIRRRGEGVAGMRPDLALAALLGQAERELTVRRRELERIEATIAQFMHDHMLGEQDRGAPPGIELVAGFDGLTAVVAEAVHDHSGEVLSMVRPPVGEAPVPLLVARAAVAGGRRLEWRSLHAHDALEGPGDGLAAELGRVGATIRVGRRVPLKILIFAGRAALLKADPERQDQGDMLVVRNPSILAALTTMFELFWERATPMGRLGGGLAAPDQRLLRLLAAGLQDEAVADELGVSVRTVRRRVADLMEDLGARTRFQAGTQAARKGLL